MEPEENKEFPFDTQNNLNIQPSVHRKSKFDKKTILLLIILILIIATGFFIFKNNSSIKKVVVGPTPAPTSTPQLSPTPSPLVRSQWSFEVLNGSGTTGLAKKIGDKIKDLGYQVVKTGNADKDDYPKTQILVKKEFSDKVDLLVADLKDIIKIASYAGELKDSTASARIILGKDSTQ